MKHESDGLVVDDAPALTDEERQILDRHHKVIQLDEYRRRQWLERNTVPMGGEAA